MQADLSNMHHNRKRNRDGGMMIIHRFVNLTHEFFIGALSVFTLGE